MPGYLNLASSDPYCVGGEYGNRAPESVMRAAIAPPNASPSILVPVDFATSTPQSAYFVFYFLDFNASWKSNETRKFEMRIDGVLRHVVDITGDRSAHVVTCYPVPVMGTVNVTISPASGSVLPPINAMEVFTATELLE
ncbi:hypothetical protein L1049_011773 [Liquidambar formosana]|uniref:Malectin-like domain-containing protein n=1 Tax=Liquidambar formosana TaxID=63359 RepID=A0AAP0X023_LIQFO